MQDSTEARLAALVQRVSDLADDLHELREIRKEDHHRLRNVESAVKGMVDAQKLARDAEDRQYRRVANALQWGGFAVGLGLFALALITLLVHTAGP